MPSISWNELEKENARLKRAVADLTLDKAILKEIAEGAERVNQVWSYDFVFDQTETGSRLKWLPVLDEYSHH
ncbi:MAG: hypothetical protein ACFUZC_03865 [Chthoniobacteraceae bacterium]